MNFHIEQATPENAQDVIDFMNRVGGETDNLTFGKGEFIQQDSAKEADFIRQQSEQGGFMLLAWSDRSRKKGGPQLMGQISVDRGDRPRTRHRAELAISVLREFWGQGVATRLMEYALGRVKGDQGIEVLSCVVRCDNVRAISLYERFGMERTGTVRGILKLPDGLCDAYLMSRVFHRAVASPDKPLFYLDEVEEAIDFSSDNISYYACLDTGVIEMCMSDGWDSWGDEDEFDPDEAEGTWVSLPDRREIDDWGCMRDFAMQQNDMLCNRLLNIIHHRRAYSRFKDECARHGLLNSYFAFQGLWHRRVAINWLDSHGCTWTEGSRPR